MESWKEYEGKKVFIQLKNQRKYKGRVVSVDDKITCSIFKIKDKYGKLVGFYDSEISVIQEEGVDKKVDKEVDNADN